MKRRIERTFGARWTPVIAMVAGGVVSCGDGDAPESVEPTPQEQPLQQTRSVPFQLDLGDGESLTLHMPAGGMLRLLAPLSW